MNLGNVCLDENINTNSHGPIFRSQNAQGQAWPPGGWGRSSDASTASFNAHTFTPPATPHSTLKDIFRQVGEAMCKG